MNRNTEAHFSKLPNVQIQRSLFDRSTQNKLSFNMGKLIPIFADEYLPGDTFTLDTSIVIRTSSAFIKPVMDNLYADIYYFSVPNRLVWNHWKEFMGENTSGPWTQQTEYTIPQITAPSETGWTIGTIADYFSIPTGVPNISITQLFFRAYGLIWNEYFRDENLMNPTDVPMTDATITGQNDTAWETCASYGGYPLPVCKFHDYYTSCLPDAQRGDAVTIPIASGTIPVYGNGKNLALTAGSNLPYKNIRLLDTYVGQDTDKHQLGMYFYQSNAKIYETNLGANSQTTTTATMPAQSGNSIGLPTKAMLQTPAASGVVADVSAIAGPNVNELREAIALQRLLERSARGGSRYIETIKAHFNVNSPDARLQRPEYLGGKRIPITISQVVQMSGTETEEGLQATEQGNVSAYSLTTDKSSSFTKSFTEHGMIIGLMCVRQEHTYQQGINPMFSRTRKYQFYWPSLANLGEEAIDNKTIYAQGTTTDAQKFGFQERWAEYRYKPSIVCGEMRSQASNSLDVYHFADYYQSLPQLGASWIAEDQYNIDRTLAVTSNVSNQFIADIYFSYRCARPMPTYSVPGLMDHF